MDHQLRLAASSSFIPAAAIPRRDLHQPQPHVALHSFVDGRDAGAATVATRGPGDGQQLFPPQNEKTAAKTADAQETPQKRAHFLIAQIAIRAPQAQSCSARDVPSSAAEVFDLSGR
jgi:hypothetical protein